MNYNDLLKFVPEDKISEAKELADKISQEQKDSILKNQEKLLAEKADALAKANESKSLADKYAKEKADLENTYTKEKSLFEAEKANLRLERTFSNYSGDELEFAKMKVQNEIAKGVKEEDAINTAKEAMKKMFATRQDLPPMNGTTQPHSSTLNQHGEAAQAFDAIMASINPEYVDLMKKKGK
jgi:hypothetical protein